MEDLNLDKVIEILKNKFKVQVIILFGSYARGKQRNDSDVDIAFKSDEEFSRMQIWEMKNEIEDILNKEVDLINIDSEISEGFRYEILMSGKLIYVANKQEFEKYKLLKCSQYLTFNEDRKIIIDKIKKGGTLYGK